MQHYEMLGCRALYQDGWKAVTYQEIQVDEPRLDEAVWELYDLRADPSECHDRAGAEPERLAAMIERWWQEAERHQVLPLDNRPFSELVFQRTPSVPARARYTYWPGRAPVPESVAVQRAVARARHHRPHHRPRRPRRARGRAGGPGLGARWVVVPPPG